MEIQTKFNIGDVVYGYETRTAISELITAGKKNPEIYRIGFELLPRVFCFRITKIETETVSDSEGGTREAIYYSAKDKLVRTSIVAKTVEELFKTLSDTIIVKDLTKDE